MLGRNEEGSRADTDLVDRQHHFAVINLEVALVIRQTLDELRMSPSQVVLRQALSRRVSI